MMSSIFSFFFFLRFLIPGALDSLYQNHAERIVAATVADNSAGPGVVWGGSLTAAGGTEAGFDWGSV